MTTARPARWRNIAFYVTGVMVLSLCGGWIIADGQEIGALIFILSPVLMATLLRTFGREGWHDAGLRLRGEIKWYLLAVLGFPLIFAGTLGLGALTGHVRFAEGFIGTALLAFLTQLAPRMIFSITEEFGWRGYLEPRLTALGVPAARRHLLVAAIWGVWHVPYIVATEGYTQLPLGVHLPLFMLAMVAMSCWYGVVQSHTQSVWPAVLAHGVANTLAFPLLNPALVNIDPVLFFAARPEALLPLTCLVLLAVVVWRLRPRNLSAEAPS